MKVVVWAGAGEVTAEMRSSRVVALISISSSLAVPIPGPDLKSGMETLLLIWSGGPAGLGVVGRIREALELLGGRFSLFLLVSFDSFREAAAAAAAAAATAAAAGSEPVSLGVRQGIDKEGERHFNEADRRTSVESVSSDRP